MPTLTPDGRRLNGKGGGWITKTRRLAIYLRDGFECLYCGRDLRDAHPRELTLDHLRPRCKDGKHHERNLVTACLRCNSARQDRPWTQYATGGSVDRIRRNIRRTLNVQLAKGLLAGTARNEAAEQPTNLETPRWT
jgi:5-methylcytosine-specific restriction endonuclease McrA